MSADQTPDEVPIKSYIDSQFAETRRQRDAALQSRRIELEDALDSRLREGVPLQEHITAVLEEQRRALDVASAEREKAAQALALQREKAAEALAEAMRAAVEQGDAALKDHIGQQVQQIRAALVSADELERARISAVEDRVEAVRSELRAAVSNANEAVAKAEAATEKRFASVNEFRAQLSDQTASFLPREVADAQFAELRKAHSTLVERVNSTEGKDAGRTLAFEGFATSAQLWLAAAAIVLSVLVANGVFR